MKCSGSVLIEDTSIDCADATRLTDPATAAIPLCTASSGCARTSLTEATGVSLQCLNTQGTTYCVECTNNSHCSALSFDTGGEFKFCDATSYVCTHSCDSAADPDAACQAAYPDKPVCRDVSLGTKEFHLCGCSADSDCTPADSPNRLCNTTSATCQPKVVPVLHLYQQLHASMIHSHLQQYDHFLLINTLPFRRLHVRTTPALPIVGLL